MVQETPASKARGNGQQLSQTADVRKDLRWPAAGSQEEEEMKEICCPTCKTKIERKSRYEKGDGEMLPNFKEPCNTCAHNMTDEDEMPCRFCTDY